MMATRGGAEFLVLEKELSGEKAISYNASGLVVLDKEKIRTILGPRIDEYCGERKGGPWNIVDTSI